MQLSHTGQEQGHTLGWATLPVCEIRGLPPRVVSEYFRQDRPELH